MFVPFFYTMLIVFIGLSSCYDGTDWLMTGIFFLLNSLMFKFHVGQIWKSKEANTGRQ